MHGKPLTAVDRYTEVRVIFVVITGCANLEYPNTGIANLNLP